jgi:preprotein translocase subunit SecG
MNIILVTIHIVVCFALILIVLLQTGKGADMGAAFGGGTSQTLFGSTGASTFLSKLTTAAAIIFMITSLSLAYLSGDKGGESIMTGSEPAVTQPAETKEADQPNTTTTSQPAQSDSAETKSESE